jgi:hypothetical protein
MKRHEFSCPDRVFLENLIEANSTKRKLDTETSDQEHAKKARECDKDDDSDDVSRTLTAVSENYKFPLRRQIEVQATIELTSSKILTHIGQLQTDLQPGIDFCSLPLRPI